MTVSTILSQSNDPQSKSWSGTITKKSTGIYSVQTDGRLQLCELSPRLRASLAAAAGSHAHRAAEHLDPVAVGDKVRCIQSGNGNGLIVELYPRRSQFSRRSAVPMPTARAHEQVIAANVDQVVPVFAAAEPPPKWNMLDRYLVSAEGAGLPAVIILTKLDLAQDEQGHLDAELAEVAAEYRRIGYPVLLVSAHRGEGLAEVQQALEGKVSVLLGKSGVGKTSLLNALQPGLGLRVNEVSQVTGKGKHTTTTMEMFPLEFGVGGGIVDTPGVREFGLWLEEGAAVDWFFPEMRPYIGQCRFGLDCEHDREPGCAVQQAVSAGQIHPRRWQSYLSLKGEA
jgi:ribosome biogenesis GTPase